MHVSLCRCVCAEDLGGEGSPCTDDDIVRGLRLVFIRVSIYARGLILIDHWQKRLRALFTGLPIGCVDAGWLLLANLRFMVSYTFTIGNISLWNWKNYSFLLIVSTLWHWCRRWLKITLFRFLGIRLEWYIKYCYWKSMIVTFVKKPIFVLYSWAAG